MQTTFVSHAGFLVCAGSTRILVDPWTQGKAFNNSWALVSRPYNVDYMQVDYIWVSHEHPDHFSVPTLKAIPESDRRRITILYQYHASPRLRDAFIKLQFDGVIELPLYRWYRLNVDVELYCASAGSMDSAIAIRADNRTLLNLNDCILNKRQLKYIKRKIGEIDVLFTQFSFANWVGNDSDELAAAETKIAQLRQQNSVIAPRTIIPFASFAYFCNAENARMNAWANTPRKISELDIENLKFMYPGDILDFNHELDSDHAVKRFMNDLQEITVDPTPSPVKVDDITSVVQEQMELIHDRINRRFLQRIDPLTVYAYDIETCFKIDVAKHEIEVCNNIENARFQMCSQVLHYWFAHTWGGGTLEVSGMYYDFKRKSRGRHNLFFIQNMLNTEFLAIKKNTGRVLKFLFAKRHEILNRYLAARGRNDF